MADDYDLDVPERRAAAAAMNRLSHALVRHRASREVLSGIAVEADRLASSIEDEPVRQRRIEFLEDSKVVQAIRDGGNPAQPDGAFLDMFDDSPVSGSANPLSIGLKIATFDDHAVGQVTLQPGWQGAPGRAHGGVVASVIDEVLGAMLPVLKVVAFTGELTVRYVAPTPIGVPLEFVARKTGEERRKIFLECVGTTPDGEVFATAKSTFITVDLASFEGLT